MTTTSIPIRFGRLRWLFIVLAMSPRSSRIALTDDTVDVRMGWAFHTTFPRASVRTATVADRPVWWSIGVHGWRGEWLVNGSADGVVWLAIEPSARARVLGFPVALRRLGVSVDAPSALVHELVVPDTGPRA